MRLVHLHIPKTAGTSLRESIALAHPDIKVRKLPYPAPEHVSEDVDVLSGHICYSDAVRYGGRVVTVLRHPVDRFVSVYFFWRQLYRNGVERTRKTSLANKMSLLDFSRAYDEPELASELYNRMAWQIHSDFTLAKRYQQRIDNGVNMGELVDQALNNLRNFEVVGFQDRYSDFVSRVNESFGLNIQNLKINVTEKRSSIEDLTHAELTAVLGWVEADMEIYTSALREFS